MKLVLPENFKQIVTISLALILGVLGSLTQTVNAANGITLAPYYYNGIHNAGDEVVLTFNVTNAYDHQTNITLSATSTVLTDQGTDFDSLHPETSWWEYDNSLYTLEPHETRTYTSKITIPAETQVGTYMPTLLVRIGNQETTVEGTASVNTDIAYTANINVIDSHPINNLQVTKLKTPGIVFTNNISVEYGITNNNPIQSQPIGYLQLVNPKGEIIFKQVINENGGLLMPGKTLGARVDIEFPDGGIEKLGTYRVELLVVDQFTGNSNLLTTNFTFIQNYLLLVLITMGVVALLGIITLALLRRKKSKRFPKGAMISGEFQIS